MVPHYQVFIPDPSRHHPENPRPQLHDKPYTNAASTSSTTINKPPTAGNGGDEDPDMNKPYCMLCSGPHSWTECPKHPDSSRTTRCGRCNKWGHSTRQCHKRNSCRYCHCYGHRLNRCTDPHRYCQCFEGCLAHDHPRHPHCPTESTEGEDLGDYGDYDFDINWEAEDRGD